MNSQSNKTKISDSLQGVSSKDLAFRALDLLNQGGLGSKKAQLLVSLIRVLRSHEEKEEAEARKNLVSVELKACETDEEPPIDEEHQQTVDFLKVLSGEVGGTYGHALVSAEMRAFLNTLDYQAKSDFVEYWIQRSRQRLKQQQQSTQKEQQESKQNTPFCSDDAGGG